MGREMKWQMGEVRGKRNREGKYKEQEEGYESGLESIAMGVAPWVVEAFVRTQAWSERNTKSIRMDAVSAHV